MNTWIKNSIFLGTILLMGMACYGQELTNEIAWNIKYGNTEQLEKLIAPEAINGCFGVADSKKYNYLAMSIKLKSMKSLQYFIAKGADIEGVCADKTPLMYAAKYGPLEMVRIFGRKRCRSQCPLSGQNSFGLCRSIPPPRHSEVPKRTAIKLKTVIAKVLCFLPATSG